MGIYMAALLGSSHIEHVKIWMIGHTKTFETVASRTTHYASCFLKVAS